METYNESNFDSCRVNGHGGSRLTVFMTVPPTVPVLVVLRDLLLDLGPPLRELEDVLLARVARAVAGEQPQRERSATLQAWHRILHAYSSK